jgi:ribosomal protein S27AE
MMERRNFLRGSILFAAAAAITPGIAFGGQDQSQGGAQQQPDTQDDGQRNQGEPPAADGTPAPGDSSNVDKDKDPSRVTHKDADGLEYRECPQCGFNMYRHDRTWTCENCGYSYTE